MVELTSKELSVASFIQHGSLLVVAMLSSANLGGGMYECLVIDPFWPIRPDLIQPVQGGISRGRFWLPFHISFEIVLIFCLVQEWSSANVRVWLLFALATHAAARIWSAFDFIPKALAFEKATVVDQASAKRWTQRSRFRLPIALLTVMFLLCALEAAFSR
jgi:hypothetical protein